MPHYERIQASARLLMMDAAAHRRAARRARRVELLRRDGLREDVYVRPIVYKSSEAIGVRLHNLDADSSSSPCRSASTSTPTAASGRRSRPGAGPMTTPSRRAARSPAPTSTVRSPSPRRSSTATTRRSCSPRTATSRRAAPRTCSSSSAASSSRPPVTDNILEGITRAGCIALARERLGVPVEERQIDRTELYSRRRGVPVRHRRPAIARWSRSTGGDRRPDGRADHPAAARHLLRRGARPRRRLPRLADAGLLNPSLEGRCRGGGSGDPDEGTCPSRRIPIAIGCLSVCWRWSPASSAGRSSLARSG